MIVICFFFFKQKTAYEVRISYWSSDVCSSDLMAWPAFAGVDAEVAAVLGAAGTDGRCSIRMKRGGAGHISDGDAGSRSAWEAVVLGADAEVERSEESSVGKEGDRTGRSRWGTYNKKKKTTNETSTRRLR